MTLTTPSPGAPGEEPAPQRPDDVATFGAPARAWPLLAWLQRHPPYPMVIADRTSAGLVTVPGGALHGAKRAVIGPDDEMERNAPD